MKQQIKNLDLKVTTISQELILLKEVIAASFTKVETNFGIVEKN